MGRLPAVPLLSPTVHNLRPHGHDHPTRQPRTSAIAAGTLVTSKAALATAASTAAALAADARATACTALTVSRPTAAIATAAKAAITATIAAAASTLTSSSIALALATTRTAALASTLTLTLSADSMQQYVRLCQRRLRRVPGRRTRLAHRPPRRPRAVRVRYRLR